MIRRTAMTALSAAALMPVLLRSAGAQTAPGGGAQPAPGGGVQTAPGAGGQPAPGMDVQLLQRILVDSVFSLASSELALQKAQAPAVKTFAQFEVNEQRATMQAMKIGGLPLPAQIDMDGPKMQLLQQLRGLDGAQFDLAYLQGQIAVHQELLQLYQPLLAAGTVPEQVIATLSVAAIQQHIAMLQAIA
ncbi:DUF4142 domain-containing protein [Roseomonas marmotae]|uniref:DUF4142 domain-containing protein n=1 Tax=Roseomonas marmotae TaxID=2768161 RepID=A0ABS3KHY8_9PROT|nr:DUF4142 domain-containing protein [Roseomonas marmotae]MBO1075936.1 DUF4142 domain-containing protein [Roseomonas marmotae]QTI80072.1 DUF4142 domain-containing protein [Roseomonas marmotae]